MPAKKSASTVASRVVVQTRHFLNLELAKPSGKETLRFSPVSF